MFPSLQEVHGQPAARGAEILPRTYAEATGPAPLPGLEPLAPCSGPRRASQLETHARGPTACCLGHSCRKLHDPGSWGLEHSLPHVGDNKARPGAWQERPVSWTQGRRLADSPTAGAGQPAPTEPLEEARFLQHGLLEAEHGAHEASEQRMWDLNSGLGAGALQGQRVTSTRSLWAGLSDLPLRNP